MAFSYVHTCGRMYVFLLLRSTTTTCSAAQDRQYTDTRVFFFLLLYIQSHRARAKKRGSKKRNDRREKKPLSCVISLTVFSFLSRFCCLSLFLALAAWCMSVFCMTNIKIVFSFVATDAWHCCPLFACVYEKAHVFLFFFVFLDVPRHSRAPIPI